MPSVAQAPPIRRMQRPRATPPVLDGPGTLLHSATILLIESDVKRRDRYASALERLPANLIVSSSHTDGYVQAIQSNVAVVITDGRDDPRGTIDFFRKLREQSPFVVSILIGIEWDRLALLEAINDIHAFRVLAASAQDIDVRAAALQGLAAERDKREAARMNQTWVRDLLNKVEAALPGGALRHYEEKGEALPFDLIMRTGTKAAISTAETARAQGGIL